MKLQLDCLLNMSKISNLLKEQDEQEVPDDGQTWTIYERAYDVNEVFMGEVLLMRNLVC